MCKLFVGADPRLWESRTRSIRMDGMVTSLRLESLFWTVLEEIAASEDLSLSRLLHRLYDEAIDEGRELGNFASFLRVCCLRFADLKAKGVSLSAGARPRAAGEILRLESAASPLPSYGRGAARSLHLFRNEDAT